MQTSYKDGKQDFFEIEISKSSLLDAYTGKIDWPGSVAAYLFYHNLGDERNQYPSWQLAHVDRKMNVMQNILEHIGNKEFDAIKTMIKPDTTYLNCNPDTIIANIIKREQQLGPMKEFVPLGFLFSERNNGRSPIVHIAGLMICKKSTAPISVDMDVSTNNNDIIGLKLEK